MNHIIKNIYTINEKETKRFQEGIIQNEEYGVLCLKAVFTCHSNKSFSIVAGRIEGMIS